MFEPVDLIHGHDILDDETFASLLCLCESGLVGAALAAPYSCKHSRATLRRPGPMPVRTPEFLDGVPGNSVDQQLAVQEPAIVHDRARLLLSAVSRNNGLLILENPATSMTWLDDLMWTWVHSMAPYAAHAAACRFGADWAKTWCFVSNKADILALGLSCNHEPNSHESVVGVRLPDGTSKSRLTAEYAAELALALANIIKSFTTNSGRIVELAKWRTLLPQRLSWPALSGRIEDGGGLPSAALHLGAMDISPWPLLRKRWFERLCSSRDCLRIVANLTKGSSEAPLNAQELKPYLDDLLQVFDVQHRSDDLQYVAPGQPFKLRLWKLLALSWNDPDAPFLDTLQDGVRLGVHGYLDPSPAWPQRDPALIEDHPLVECTSAWKSALDHAQLVRDLVAAEVADGFAALVPGGVDELRSKYDQVAIGKLGVVLAAGRSPRLVVDSSVSNVTSNTAIPNHMLLPKISDVMRCAPLGMAAEQVTQLTLDVSKAHRRILIHPDDRGLLCFHVGEDL
eukprot:s1010_g34.t1